MNQQFDAIVVGGGIVGLTAAALLAKQGRQVAVIESHKAPAPIGDDYSLRVSAINFAVQKIFSAIGIWSDLLASRTSTFREMRVWDQAEIHFHCAEIAQPCLGYIIENELIRYTLWQVLKNNKNVKLFCEDATKSLEIDEQGVTLTLDNAQIVKADLIIGADGANSWVREQAGIELKRKPYEQTAIVANVHTEKSHHKTAWQRFLPSGPLALLPLSDTHLCSIVWSVDSARGELLLALPESDFEKVLTQDFDNRLGKLSLQSKVQGFPLYERHVKHYVKEGVALIGDAAHTIHPLAGQGVNLGILDAACLAEVLQKAKLRDENIGRYYVLRRYERWRKGENMLMIKAMMGFKNLFASETKLLAQSRNMGLSLVNKVAPLKTIFMRRAMGLTGDLPKISS